MNDTLVQSQFVSCIRFVTYIYQIPLPNDAVGQMSQSAKCHGVGQKSFSARCRSRPNKSTSVKCLLGQMSQLAKCHSRPKVVFGQMSQSAKQAFCQMSVGQMSFGQLAVHQKYGLSLDGGSDYFNHRGRFYSKPTSIRHDQHFETLVNMLMCRYCYIFYS